MTRKLTARVLVLAGCVGVLAAQRDARLWNDEAVASQALPLAGLGAAPGHVPSAEYYRAPIDNLRTYPVYHPTREPAGYREDLLRRGPRPLVEPKKLVSERAWLDAGRRVFEELDIYLTRTDDPVVIAHFTDAASVDRYRDERHDVVTEDGVILGYRWVVDEDERLKLSMSSCAGCHTHVLPDGKLLPGGPSNFDLAFHPALRQMLQQLRVPGMSRGEELYASFGVPWLDDDRHAPFATWTDGQVFALLGAENGAPPGATFDRINGSPYHTTRMADLRGIADRRFFDATATHRNRGPEDLARYAILVEYADAVVFGPHRMAPAEVLAADRRRPLDEAMLAMARYLYSLDVPPSPHASDERAARGRQIFDDEGCAKCHAPPHYTDNRLVAVPGFAPPASTDLPVAKRRVDTDPGLALRTRKGTGYYKVPSLRGLWYRELLGHSGSVASLEEWFDERRLSPEHVPGGWRGPGVTKRAVPGHEFGLDLEPDEKAALIAFLRTL